MLGDNYTADLPGGTATVTIQMQKKKTLKQAVVSVLNAAVGKLELSTSPTSQIGTAQPTSDVQLRLNQSAGTGASVSASVVIPLNLPVQAFQSLYVHQTGAGNLGSITLS
jgi:hypothetical protein